MPIACRRTESTMAILVNDVIMIRSAGAMERTVSSRNIWRTTETCPGSSSCFTLILKKGELSVGVAEKPSEGTSNKKPENTAKLRTSSFAVSKAFFLILLPDIFRPF